MIKCKVIEDFKMDRFNELKNLKRADKDRIKYLYVGDTFECSEELADYLMGNNPIKKKVIKTLKVVPKKCDIIDNKKAE